MSEEQQKEPEVLCLCSGATKEQIKSLVDEGTVDIERISRITGALSGCGGCESNLKEFVGNSQADDSES